MPSTVRPATVRKGREWMRNTMSRCGGDRSLESLTRYIHKWMPEDEQDLVVDEEAEAVSRYVFEAFYSPAAQARLHPPRVELLRLTNHQFRQSVADLFASLRGAAGVPKPGGLKARYFEVEKMNFEKRKLAERVDPTVSFDFGEGVPIPEMERGDFSIRWEGSLIAPESGWFDFRIRTHNGALMHLNAFAWKDTEDVFIDAVGRYRTMDNHKAVNTVSDYVTDREEIVEVRSAKDLAKLAVESETAHRAFITHLFHHLVKQPVAAYGPDTLESLRRKFVDSGYHIRSLVVEIALVAAGHHQGEPTASASLPHSN